MIKKMVPLQFQAESNPEKEYSGQLSFITPQRNRYGVTLAEDMSKTTINETATAFDLKGAAFTIPVLSLRNSDMDMVSAQLVKKVRQAPAFFYNAPVVINLRHVLDADQLDFTMLIDLVRGQGFIPVGITGGTAQQQKRARAMELAVLTTRSGGKQQEEPVETEDGEFELEEKADCNRRADSGRGGSASSLLITEPVRSGQRVAVDQGDLIVMSSVSSGAEITTPGNIHVYGALRGRAFAGNNGDDGACIFCQHLEAELVAVAGVYLVNENFPDALRSLPVQIQLQAGRIRIKAL